MNSIGIPEFFRKRLVSNALSLYVVQGLNYVLPLLLFPYLLRALGPSAYGSIIFAQSIIGYAVVTTDFGFNLTAARDISVARDDPAEIAKIFWTTMAAKCVLLLACAIILSVAIAVVPELRHSWRLVTISSAIVLGSIVFPQWYFQGLERLGEAALVQAASKLIYAVCIVVFVKSAEDLWIAAFIMSGQQLFAVVAAAILRKRITPLSFYLPTLNDVGRALSSGWPMFLGNASSTLYGNTNTFVLGLMGGEIAVAHYNLGIRIISAIQGLATPITQAVFPRASFVFSQDSDRGWALLWRVSKFLLPAIAFISIGVGFFAPQIVVILGGISFTDAASTLRLMLPVPLLVALGTLLAHCAIVNIGLSNMLVRVYVIVGVANLLMLPFLIEWFSADGAAISLTVSETLVEILLIWVLWRRAKEQRRG